VAGYKLQYKNISIFLILSLQEEQGRFTHYTDVYGSSVASSVRPLTPILRHAVSSLLQEGFQRNLA